MTALPSIASGMADVLTALGRSVTHRKVTAGAYNATTMTRATTVVTTSVTMLREPTTAQTISGAGPDVDERIYTCLQSALAQVDANDELVDGTVTLQVVAVEQTADSIGWRITDSSMFLAAPSSRL